MKTLLMAAISATFITLGTTSSAEGATFIFSTSDNQFTPGIDNQGWWSPPRDRFNGSGNYVVGRCCGDLHRNFFTFDLSSLKQKALSATLELRRYYGAGDQTQTLGLFDVSTSAATLNNSNVTSATIFATVFKDLGTGKSYGTFDVSTTGNSSGILELTLNSTAIADINAAAGSFFSIGGALDSESLSSPGGSQDLFGFSSSVGPQRLVVETVPESSSVLGTLAFGILGAGWAFRQRQRKLKTASSAKNTITAR